MLRDSLLRTGEIPSESSVFSSFHGACFMNIIRRGIQCYKNGYCMGAAIRVSKGPHRSLFAGLDPFGHHSYLQAREAVQRQDNYCSEAASGNWPNVFETYDLELLSEVLRGKVKVFCESQPQ
jgi:hypothetical protein